MQNIIFSNGTTLPLANTITYSKYYRHQEREFLELHFEQSDTTHEQLKNLAINASDSIIIHTEEDVDGDTVTTNYEYRLYTEFDGISDKVISVSKATPETPEVVQEIYVLSLYQPTYAEQQLQQLQATVDALVIAGLEG